MASAALGVAQAGAGAVGSINEAASIRLQSDIEAKQSEFNSRVAEFQSSEAIKRGNKQVELARRASKQMIGKQRAALAAQGIALDEGTALALQEETAKFTAEDVETIKNNAAAEAFGFKIQSSQDKLRADLTRIGGNAAARGTLVTGATNFAYGLKKSGIGKYLDNQFESKKNPATGSSGSGVDAVYSSSKGNQ